MQNYSTWRIEPTKILTRRELACVLEDLHSRAVGSRSAWLNLIIFRLACCCGLRASEIAGLRCDDVIVGVARPRLRIRAETAKGGRGRIVPHCRLLVGVISGRIIAKSFRSSISGTSNTPTPRLTGIVMSLLAAACLRVYP